MTDKIRRGYGFTGYLRLMLLLPVLGRLMLADTAPTTASASDSDDRRQMPTLDDLRGKAPDELYELITIADAHIRALHQDERGGLRTLDDAEKAAMKILLDVREGAETRLAEHRAIQDVLKRRPESVQTALNSMGDRADADPFYGIRRLTNSEIRDRALRRLDDRSSTSHMSPEQKAEVEKQLRRDSDIGRRILVTETEPYRNAWMKLVTNPNAQMILTDEERDAVRAYEEYRAMAEWTTTTGGFGIPVNQAA